MEDLKKIREKITDIDNRMAGLFEARMQQVAKVAEYKRQNGLPIYDPKREAEVIAKGEARVEAVLRAVSAGYDDGIASVSGATFGGAAGRVLRDRGRVCTYCGKPHLPDGAEDRLQRIPEGL